MVDALAESVQAAIDSGRRMGSECVNLEHFVLQHGHHWTIDTTQPLPRGFPPGERGQCHANATRLVTQHEDLVYVEGYVLHTSLPIRHAWVQLPGGDAVDTTFAGLEHLSTLEYFGVPFQTDFLLMTSLKAGEFMSLIDDYPARWPLLSASSAELAEALWSPD
ncbi:MAG TPA: hypothetical protein DEA08_06375 [Planctomycetes bacterium]|nr:hypothetical protein [Planctomycetota bacterium]